MSGLRKALVDLANRWDLESVEPAEDFVDAMFALLPEHRDEVRALIGDERLRSLLLAVTPTHMGATPDLAWPDGYDGEDPWQQWEDDVMAALAPREEP